MSLRICDIVIIAIVILVIGIIPIITIISLRIAITMVDICSSCIRLISGVVFDLVIAATKMTIINIIMLIPTIISL